MPKQMKRTNSVAPSDAVTETAQPEPETAETSDSIELEGNTIRVRHDFSRRKMLREKPLLLLDKSGVDVRQSQPDWHYAWFDEGDLRIRLEEGYDLVTDQDVYAPAQSKKNREQNAGRIMVNELTACRIPTAEWNAWNDYIERTETRAAELALEEYHDNALRHETDGVVQRGDSSYGGISTQRVNK